MHLLLIGRNGQVAMHTVSEMAALCVPETDLSCDLCEECGKELETHCFVHIVEID